MYKIKIKRLSSDINLPSFAYAGDAGADLYAAEEIEIYPGDIATIPTGIAIQLPEPTESFRFEAQIRPRSSTFKNYHVLIPNSPATIDYGYRGEILVPVFLPINRAHISDMCIGMFASGIYYNGDPMIIKKNERFAQLIINMIPNVVYEEAQELDNSERGNKGLGSSGK